MYLRKIGLRALIAAALVLPLVADAYEVWSGEYRAYNEDWFRAATFISGGDWIVVGSNNETTSKLTENLRMIRIDETGEVVWDARILGDSPTADRRDVLRGVAPSPDGGWVTAGDLKMFAGHGDSDAWVAKWGPDGALEWSKLIGTANREYGFQIVASPSGGYFLFGLTMGDYGAVVVKLSESGVIEWRKHFEDVSVSIDTSSIAATADGGCAFVAWRSPYNFVVKLENDGVVEWMKEIGGGTWPKVVMRSIAPHPDGYVLIGEAYSRPWMVMVSGDGTQFKQYRLKMWGSSWTPPIGVVEISEVRTDLPDSEEYFELSGAPGTSLDGLTYLVIGDADSYTLDCDPDLEPADCWCHPSKFPDGCRMNSGIIEEVVDLTDQSIPDSGFFVAAEAEFGLGTADLTTDLNFEDNDNVTHLLVRGFSGALGDDLDSNAPTVFNEDGVLDVTPWTEIVDQIALIEEENEPYGTEFYYGLETLGPDVGNPPQPPIHAYRGPSGWVIGARDFGSSEDTAGFPNEVGEIVDSRGWDVIVVDDGIIWTGFVGADNWFMKTDLADPGMVSWWQEYLEPLNSAVATDLVPGPGGTFVGVGKTEWWESWMVRARASTGLAAATCSMGTRQRFIEKGGFFGWYDSGVVVSSGPELSVLDDPAVVIEAMDPPHSIYCSEINGEVYVMGSDFEDGGFGDWSGVYP